MSGNVIEIKFSGATKSLEASKINSINDLKFKKTDLAQDGYDIQSFLNGYYSFDDCLAVCSSSLEIKKACRENLIVKRNMDSKTGVKLFIIAYKLMNCDNPYVMSSNRFIAICSAQLTLAISKTVYNWDDNVYTKVGNTMIAEYKGKSVNTINRLAEKIGIKSDSILYWLYLPGVENCFDIFPTEVTAICCWRVLNKEKSGLHGDAADSIKSLSNKFTKRNVTINDIGLDRIRMYYNELESCKHTSASHINAVEFLTSISKIFGKDAKNLLTSNDIKLLENSKRSSIDI
nr:nucleocapsid protein [Clematis yellow mottle associated virus]